MWKNAVILPGNTDAGEETDKAEDANACHGDAEDADEDVYEDAKSDANEDAV